MGLPSDLSLRLHASRMIWKPKPNSINMLVSLYIPSSSVNLSPHTLFLIFWIFKLQIMHHSDLSHLASALISTAWTCIFHHCINAPMHQLQPWVHCWTLLDSHSPPQLCPSSFAAVLCDPVTRSKWLTVFYKQLDNSYTISTFSCSQIPPSDATALDR
jgi:hypothetical protein